MRRISKSSFSVSSRASSTCRRQRRIYGLPYPEEIAGEFITGGTSWSITEDRAGNMWFSTNGYGAFKYDGHSFTQFSEKDGLTDNSVDVVMEDSRGNMWFGTRFGGVSRYDGTSFTNYTSRDSIGNNEVCALYEDRKGNIWFSSEGFGVYCFNGESFTNYSLKQGLGVMAVQTIFEDKEGRFWVGGGGGLYRFDGKSFLNVTKNGPWE
ncbi:MAG: two-component regulator propeller domain-containing protein [Chloroflexota bacterium]